MKTLKTILKEMDIQTGDILLVSSDIVKLWAAYRHVEKDFTLEDIIYSLMELVTPEGTLLFPTFNWDFCNGVAFDINITKGKTGALGDMALKLKEFKRTQHPIYSFAVWGKEQGTLCSLNNQSAFGKDSPFAFLHHRNGKNLVIGVKFNHCFTFAHYVEESVGVPYRYLKEFTGTYIDENRKQETKTYSMYVRAVDQDVVHVPDIDAFVDKALVEKSISYMGISFKTLHFKNAYEAFLTDILQNKGRNFVSYHGQ